MPRRLTGMTRDEVLPPQMVRRPGNLWNGQLQYRNSEYSEVTHLYHEPTVAS